MFKVGWVEGEHIYKYFPKITSKLFDYSFYIRKDDSIFKDYGTPESMEVYNEGFLHDYFQDINNPTENEINMFELRFNVPIRGYFSMRLNNG